jgi:transcriptional regulator with XRE-family HTH domain
MGTFGQALRDAREDLGVTLAEAERETRINRRYLEALENEDASSMPAAVYTRGFIRTYCQYLGLNPEGMLDLYGPQKAIQDQVRIRPIPAEINTPRSIPFRPAVVLAGLIVAYTGPRGGSDTFSVAGGNARDRPGRSIPESGRRGRIGAGARPGRRCEGDRSDLDGSLGRRTVGDGGHGAVRIRTELHG